MAFFADRSRILAAWQSRSISVIVATYDFAAFRSFFVLLMDTVCVEIGEKL
jgi:hypothetical protein